MSRFVVHLTPLILGVPGKLEYEGGGTTSIAEADATLVEQFADVEVTNAINDGFTGKVTLSMHDEITADLEPWAQALRICLLRDGETVPEVMVWGPCNVTEDYTAETVTLEAQDQSARLQHHYIRRGDTDYLGNPILNLPDDRGIMRLHPDKIGPIINAGMNTLEQQARQVPALALSYYIYGENFIDIEDAPFTQFERGQECWALIQEFAKGISGPDLIMEPRWTWDATIYGYLTAWDSPTDPEAPTDMELGRNLDPADPDDPLPGDVIWEYGMGLDNLEDLKVTPTRATTHAHVLDRDKAYRVTSAEADSSAQIGIWVDWIETDQTVPRPGNDEEADLRVLEAIADSYIKAYGRPPKHLTITPRPDVVLPEHYGHLFWPLGTPGAFYLGDYMRVRGQMGYRSFSTLSRLTSATLKQEGWNGDVRLELAMIPAIGGSPVPDTESQGGAIIGGGGEVPEEGGGGTGGGGAGTGGGENPSGVDAPVGDLPGWRQVFLDDFDGRTTPLGSFLSAESANWTAYPDTWHDTSGNGTYDPARTISIADGKMDLYIHSESVGGVMRRCVSAPVPKLDATDPAVLSYTAWGREWTAMLYGRYAVRFRADSLAQYKTAWLLWPTSNVWPRDGEIDFPEGDLNDTIHAFMHHMNGTSGSDQVGDDSGVTYGAWHTAETIWTPTECSFVLDGTEILSATSRIPSTPMRYVLQTETGLNGVAPSYATAGHVEIDWVAIWAYDP